MTAQERSNIFSDDDEDLRPRQQSLGGVLRREGNWKCFMLTLMIAGCLGSVAWCNTAEIDRDLIDFSNFVSVRHPIKRTVRESPCDVGYAYIPIAFVLLLYLVYLVECYHSTARIQLARRVDVAAVSARVHAMRNATPRVWWKAICYHYVRRKRQVTRYRNGDAYTTTQVYYERVNTHSASTSFAHACCGQRDASRNLVLDSKTPITKVRFSKGFAFANIEAASEFEDQRSRFFAEHERFDDFMEMREGLDLIGVSSFKEYMVAYSHLYYRDADRCPWYSSQLLFWTLSCLLLSWPLRILIECNTAYVHYTITKIFGTNYELDPSRQLDIDTHMSDTLPPVTANNYAWALADEQSAVLCSAPRPPRTLPLSHASTVDSLELFAAIRGNCALVPSYSEAMRIDAALREEPAAAAADDGTDSAAAGVVIDMEPEARSSPLRTAKAASFDEPPRRPKVTIATTHSTQNISATARSNEAKQLNRRSWAGVLTTARSARQILEEFRSSNSQTSYEQMPEPQVSENGETTLYFSRELSPTCSRDPFGGRAQTTPTDEPPSYEEALKMPALRKLTRSITGTNLAGSRRAFLRDVLTNRRSCLEGVGVLAGTKVVRLPYSESGDETPL
ncbi:transmembrane protein 151B-like isoform X1 [Spodoptera litura]|uniref:Transmembrane protein 151B-like isoform X1 n=1 Tax=Spodoptera litura TaxID=69820 RepID=A0A9J7EEQ7_SPOLT|nr:transmembrane protein 151B-like isoform X1 [Spodoptera litura]